MLGGELSKGITLKKVVTKDKSNSNSNNNNEGKVVVELDEAALKAKKTEQDLMQKLPEFVLLIIDYSTDWNTVFGTKTVLKYGGYRLRIEQTEWKDIHVESSSSSAGCVVQIKKAEFPKHSSQTKDRVIKPDFMFVRNFPGDIHDSSFKNLVVAFMFSNIPCVNSIESIYRCMDRPLSYSQMLKVSRRLESQGNKPFFNLVPMTYLPNLRSSPSQSLLPVTQYPIVIKVSSTHAGYGKIVARSESEYADVKCILALHNDYYTIEPFVEHEYEFRIQKIGSHYRAFRRNTDSVGGWKNNWGNLRFTDHEWRDEYKVWIDEVAAMFGGGGGEGGEGSMDILAMDVLHDKEGKDWVLELNDTANGLMDGHEEEDNGYIKQLVLNRIEQSLTATKQ